MDAGSVVVSLKLDRKQFDSEIARLQQESLQLPVFAKFAKGLDTTISVKVDHKPLHELNAHLDKKLAHVKQLQKYFDSNPLKLGFTIYQSNKQIRVARTGSQNPAQSSNDFLISAIKDIANNTKKSAEFLEKLSLKSIKSNASDKQISSLEKLEKSNKKIAKSQNKSQGFLGGVFKGVSESIGSSIFQEINSGFKDIFGKNITSGFKSITKGGASAFKTGVLDNDKLQQAFAEIESTFKDKLKKATYRLGDGIVAVLEEIQEAATEVAGINQEIINIEKQINSLDPSDVKKRKELEIKKNSALDKQSQAQSRNSSNQAKIDAFLNASLKGVNSEEIIADLQKSFEEASQSIKDAFLNENFLRDFFSPAGQGISDYRKEALKERAVPLVLERALEISQTTKGKSDQLSTKAITEATKELVIAVGGYAGARGLSGKTLVSGSYRDSPGIKEDLPEGSAAIWVKNSDSDLPKDAMKDPVKKLMALLTSLAKPNLRGYSKDAAEIAAQALAAKEKNPEIKIKILGESGGGFAAEEAQQLLKILGIESDYIAVGTPDFIGSPNDTNNKMLSPDESLGAETAGRYAKLGLANRNPNQEVLGVGGHPYENYRNAELAELMNFLQGSPGDLDAEMLQGFKDASSFFKGKSKDKKSLSRSEISKLYESAALNLQKIRRFLLVSTEDTKGELEDIVKEFQSVIITLAPEDRNLSEIKSAIAKASEYLVHLQQQPGVEATLVAKQISEELSKVEDQLNQGISQFVGTNKAQYELALAELQELKSGLSDPKLAIKTSKKTPSQKNNSYKISTSDIKNNSSNQMVADFKSALGYFQSQDKASLDIGQISQLVQAAFKNLEIVQEEIQKSSEETRDDLEKILQGFAEIVVDFTPENADVVNRLISSTVSAQPKPVKEVEQQETSNTSQANKNELDQRALAIQGGFQNFLKQFKNEIQAAQELGDFAVVNQKIQDFVKYAAQAKIELEQIRKELIAIGAIAKNSSNNPASKAKATITKAAKSLTSEFRKAGNPIDVTSEVNKQVGKLGQMGNAIPAALGSGIEKSSDNASEQAKIMAQEVIESAEEVFEIQSPPKTFIRMGLAIPKAIALGIKKSFSEAVKASQEMVKEVVASGEKESDSLSLQSLFNGLKKSAQESFDFIEQKFPAIGKVFRLTKSIFLGIATFTISSAIKNFLEDISKQAFNAYVEVDRLRTSLNFSSNSKFAGAQNLKFANNTANDLGISLKPAQEGFASLNAAGRGTALQGKGIKDLYLGMSQASTVLSMSTEQNQRAFTALTQILSKGKVSAEELRQQLAESGLVGAMGIAARAIGVTEQEFDRLLSTGQIISEDFLPKFAKQLQAEFGDAAKEASANAQSSIYKFENAYLELQQKLGEAVAPAAVRGYDALATVLKLVSSVGTELGIILATITTVLSVKMVAGIYTAIKAILAAKIVTGGFVSTLRGMGAAINNSFSAQLATGMFLVLEAVNLLNQAVNTDLVKSFDDAARSAERAARESAKAFENTPKNQDGTEASSGVGRFLDNFLKSARNPFTGKKLATYKDLEQSQIELRMAKFTGNNRNLLLDGNRRLKELNLGKGDIGKLKGLEEQLTAAEQQKGITQATIKRDYVDKGRAVPAQFKRQLEEQIQAVRELNDQRSEIAKPFTLDIVRVDQQIASAKAAIETLRSPEMMSVLGDERAFDLSEQVRETLEKLKEFKAQAESTLASLKIDPVLAFSNALRQLNLVLAESQEKSQIDFNARRSQISKDQFQGFSKDIFANRKTALNSAIAEEQKAFEELQSLDTAISDFNQAAAAPQFQAIMQKLGVNQDSSVAKIADVLQNTSDEADKNILERLKMGKEMQLRRGEVEASLFETQSKALGAKQDLSLAQIQENFRKREFAQQKSETSRTNQLRSATILRAVTEAEAAEESARIQLRATEDQQANLDNQLLNLRNHHEAGIISAEEFNNRLQEINSQQVNLDKQAADQRLAVFESANRRKLEILENANRKAEAVIEIGQTTGITDIREGLLTGRTSQDKAATEQNQVEQKALRDRIANIKSQIQQTKELQFQSVISAKDSTEKQIQLNQQLAQSNQELVEKQIQAQEQLRAAIEKTYSRKKSQLELNNVRTENTTDADFVKALRSSGTKDIKSLESQFSVKTLENRSKFLKEQMQIIQDQINGINKLKLSEEDAADKKRELSLEFERLRKDQIATEKELILKSREDIEQKDDKVFSRRKAELELRNVRAENTIDADFVEALRNPGVKDIKSLELQSSVKTLQNRSKFLKEQAQIVQDQIAGINKLNLSEVEAADKKRELSLEFERLRKDQIATEKELILKSQEEQINGIEKIRQKQDSQHELQVSRVEKERSLLELYNQSLERTSKLEESRYNLAKARGDASLTGQEIDLDNTNRAFELAKRLEDRGVKGRERRNIKRELKALGFDGKKAKDILKERQELEQNIANIKLDALEREQQFQQQALANDLKRQKVAAQIAVIEAQTAKLQAENSKLQAQSELQIARTKGDSVAEEIALNKIQIADSQVGLADTKIGLALQNLADQSKLADNATLAQQATQGAEVARLEAELNRTSLDGGRMFGDLRRGKFKAPDLMKDAFDALPNLLQPEQRKIYVNQLDLKPKQGEDIYQTYMRQRQEMEDLSKKPQASDATGFQGIVEGLKSANRGVEERLEQLIQQMGKMATPRSLTVTTANPVDDAGKILNEVSRNTLRGAGV